MIDDPKWNGTEGRGGITWAERSRMGPLRGVLDPADASGRRNRYFHLLHEYVLRRFLQSSTREFARALDFGCGTGRFLPLLSEFARSVHAVDLSPAMVEAAKLYHRLFADSIQEFSGDVLPFADDYFDLAISFCVLSVTSRELIGSSLRELARVCVDGATFLLYEKVSDVDGLSVQFIQQELRRAGFRLRYAFPVRSGTSKVTRLAATPWLGWAAPAMARAEVEWNRHRDHRGAAHTYVEYLFVAELSEPRRREPSSFE